MVAPEFFESAREAIRNRRIVQHAGRSFSTLEQIDAYEAQMVSDRIREQEKAGVQESSDRLVPALKSAVEDLSRENATMSEALEKLALEKSELEERLAELEKSSAIMRDDIAAHNEAIDAGAILFTLPADEDEAVRLKVREDMVSLKGVSESIGDQIMEILGRYVIQPRTLHGA